jgi:hypothetical protein
MSPGISSAKRLERNVGSIRTPNLAGGPVAGANSKAFERFRLARRNRQDHVEARDVENLLDDLVEAADPQFSVGRLELLGDDEEDGALSETMTY